MRGPSRRWIGLGAAAAALLTAAGVARWRADDDAAFSAEDAQAVLDDYLDALAQEDYAAAADFLAADDDTDLAEHCEDGCLDATSIALPEADGAREYVAVVTFGEPRGHPLERSFVVGETADGRPYVRGVPPQGTGILYTPYTPR
jgi:hypothetical protein